MVLNPLSMHLAQLGFGLSVHMFYSTSFLVRCRFLSMCLHLILHIYFPFLFFSNSRFNSPMLLILNSLLIRCLLFLSSFRWNVCSLYALCVLFAYYVVMVWLSTLCINHPSIFCQILFSMRWIVLFLFPVIFCSFFCCCCS